MRLNAFLLPPSGLNSYCYFGGSQKLDAQIQRATSNHGFTHPLNYCSLVYISNTRLDNENHSMPH